LLHRAIRITDKYEEVILLLLKSGADTEALDSEGSKPDLTWIDEAKLASA